MKKKNAIIATLVVGLSIAGVYGYSLIAKDVINNANENLVLKAPTVKSFDQITGVLHFVRHNETTTTSGYDIKVQNLNNRNKNKYHVSDSGNYVTVTLPDETKVGDIVRFSLQAKGQFLGAISSSITTYDHEVKTEQQIYYERAFGTIEKEVTRAIANNFEQMYDPNYVLGHKIIGLDYDDAELMVYGTFSTKDEDYLFRRKFDINMKTEYQGENLTPETLYYMTSGMNKGEENLSLGVQAFEKKYDADFTPILKAKGAFSEYTTQGYSIHPLGTQFYSVIPYQYDESLQYFSHNGVFMATHPSKDPIIFWDKTNIYVNTQEGLDRDAYVTKLLTDRTCSLINKEREELDPYLTKHLLNYMPELKSEQAKQTALSKLEQKYYTSSLDDFKPYTYIDQKEKEFEF